MFSRFAVCGLGLLGGSFCRSLRAAFPHVQISACDLDRASLDAALFDGIIDSVFSCDDAYIECDCAIAALPVATSISVISMLLAKTGSDSVVIDMGSVKAPIVDALRDCPGFSKFVPCHPMAGAERSGYASSTNDLFAGASVVITPHDKNSADSISAVSDMWKIFGSGVVLSSPEEHDMIVARTSHLPHLLSSALTADLQHIGKKCRSFSGRGLFDMTRLSSGSPAVWSEIVALNETNISEALDEYISVLEKLRSDLSSREKTEAFLHKGVLSKKEIYG